MAVCTKELLPQGLVRKALGAGEEYIGARLLQRLLKEAGDEVLLSLFKDGTLQSAIEHRSGYLAAMILDATVEVVKSYESAFPVMSDLLNAVMRNSYGEIEVLKRLCNLYEDMDGELVRTYGGSALCAVPDWHVKSSARSDS